MDGVIREFYVTLKSNAVGKIGRSANKPYAIIAVDNKNQVFDFVNDNDDFDSVEKHHCKFAGWTEFEAKKKLGLIEPLLVPTSLDSNPPEEEIKETEEVEEKPKTVTRKPNGK